ncbi:TfoX family protein [Candidatus Thorarchaeota archaeon]|nr:MAG: TfoX family protein [Candidatus Thorarchaeota archaeon]
MTMGWQKPSEGLLRLLEASLRNIPFRRRKMFGQYALFLNGNMLAGVFEDSVFLRYPPEEQEALFSELDEVERFEPRQGRPMREYVTVPDPLFSDRDVRERLLQKTVAYVLELPPK